MRARRPLGIIVTSVSMIRKASPMAEEVLEELGPVDFLVVEFPAGEQHFNGEIAAALAELVESGTVRVLDLLILAKDADRQRRGARDRRPRRCRRHPQARRRDRRDPRGRGRRPSRGGHGARLGGRRGRVGEPVGGALRCRGASRRRPARRQWANPDPGHHRLARGRRRRRSLTMPLRPAAAQPVEV